VELVDFIVKETKVCYTATSKLRKWKDETSFGGGGDVGFQQFHSRGAFETGSHILLQEILVYDT
jgi:hypothetical protein